MGQVTKLRLTCYLVLLSIDSKTRQQDSRSFVTRPIYICNALSAFIMRCMSCHVLLNAMYQTAKALCIRINCASATRHVQKGHYDMILKLEITNQNNFENVVEKIEVTWRNMPYMRTCEPEAGPWFNIKMPSYKYRKCHCGDKTIIRPSYLHNRISCTGKMASLYWIRSQLSRYQEKYLNIKIK